MSEMQDYRSSLKDVASRKFETVSYLPELDAAARRDLNAPAALKGVLVKSVARDSRAADGGLAEGDVIVEIGESPVASIDDAQRAAEAITGHRVLLRVWRQGATIFLAIRMR